MDYASVAVVSHLVSAAVIGDNTDHRVKKFGFEHQKSHQKTSNFIIHNSWHSIFCIQYDVTPKIMRNWLARLKAKLGMRIGNYYGAEQVKIIAYLLGVPRR